MKRTTRLLLVASLVLVALSLAASPAAADHDCDNDELCYTDDLSVIHVTEDVGASPVTEDVDATPYSCIGCFDREPYGSLSDSPFGCEYFDDDSSSLAATPFGCECFDDDNNSLRFGVFRLA